jgi:hypothetical protein
MQSRFRRQRPTLLQTVWGLLFFYIAAITLAFGHFGLGRMLSIGG